MAATSFKIEGMDQLEAGLDSLFLSLQPQVREAALQSGAERILARMQELVPERTGQLRDDLAIMPGADPETLAIGPAGKSEWRAHFTEFGTIHHPAEPFIRPAFEMEEEAVRAGVRRDLASSISLAVRRAR